MMVQHLKRRPLSRYLKDFKHSQTHCVHCRKLLDRITLVRDGKIVNKIEISRLDTLLDENGWQVELDEILAPWLPSTSTNNYRIALRKYQHYQRQTCTGLVQKSSSQPASDIY